MMNAQRIMGVAAVLLALGVVFGAFGAHALRDRFDLYQIGVYEKAVLYHLVHALGMLLIAQCGAVQILAPELSSRIAGVMGVGVLIFSGSLYALAITQIKILGAITPIGGTLFIVGWVWFAWALFSTRT